jgi:methylmalonyl-CoA mutase C-terminal domain/subunit
MKQETTRILMARLGNGFEEAVGKICIAFRDAGYEIIYIENPRPEAIVAAALQEAVDHIGITTLPGTKSDDIIRIIDLLKQEDISFVQVTVGGFLDEKDIEEVKKAGAAAVFPKGTSTGELITWAKEHIRPTDNWSS